MAHFVQYHNPDLMRPFHPSKNDFAIVTSKRGGLREGDPLRELFHARKVSQCTPL